MQVPQTTTVLSASKGTVNIKLLNTDCMQMMYFNLFLVACETAKSENGLLAWFYA